MGPQPRDCLKVTVAELVQGTLMRFWNVWGVVAGVALAVFVNATPTAAQIFQHPGVLVSKAQLDYSKAQYSAKVNPFDREALNARRAHGSRTYPVQVNQYPPPIRRPTSAVRWRTRTPRLPTSRRSSGTSRHGQPNASGTVNPH